MPRMPISAADPEPGALRALARVLVGEARVLEGRLEEVLERVGGARDADRAADRSASSASMPMANFIGQERSAMWCSGPGEADVGVLGLAGHRVLRLGVCDVPALELARLGHRLAEEDAEDHPERVERGEEGGEVADDRQHHVAAAALDREREDLVLREEARHRRHAGQRQRADRERDERERHRLPEAAHAVERLGARHRPDDRAGAHEQQRLEEGVRHQVEEAGAVGGDRDAQHHVADLRDRGVRDHALEVGDGQRHRGGEQQRGAADDRAHVGGGGRELEQRVHARDQVDAGGDHRRGVDQGADRSRALHGVREPGVERQLGRLGERADQDQEAGGHERPLVGAEDLVGGLEHARVVERAGLVEQQEGADHQPDVADHVDHERLDAGLRGRAAPVPERDQQV